MGITKYVPERDLRAERRRLRTLLRQAKDALLKVEDYADGYYFESNGRLKCVTDMVAKIDKELAR